ncbi:hypothetical protein ACI2JB_10590 [Pantoea agglomerans]|uniref:hypothetical protein n=1 Tax=Enterobacter agglomerans TaxID=549 RepID=UPI00384D5F98
MDWIHQNATAVIAGGAALLSALFAGGFALLGAWLNNRQNFQRQKQLFEHETLKENRKHLTEKGEELYVLLSKWSKSVSIYQINLMQIANGMLTKDQVNELVIKRKYDYDADRMLCLLKIYFPELEISYQDVEHARELAVSFGMKYDRSEISAQECIKGVGKAGTLFDAAIKRLLSALAEAIIKRIK